jgi:uncharacterized membrane protein
MPNFLMDLLALLPNEFKVIFTAAIPIIEVKGAIPIGIALGMTPLNATFLAFLGSVIPVPLILFTIRPLFNYLKKTKTFRKMVDKLIHKSMSKSGNIKKYGYLGLFIFVAIPLPGTGVWTGSLIASLLDLRFKYAFPTILFGNLIASIIIMTLSFGMLNLFGL